MKRLRKLAEENEPSKKEIVYKFLDNIGDIVDCYAIINEGLDPNKIKKNTILAENELIDLFIKNEGIQRIQEAFEDEGYEEIDSSYIESTIKHYDNYTNQNISDILAPDIDEAINLMKNK